MEIIDYTEIIKCDCIRTVAELIKNIPFRAWIKFTDEFGTDDLFKIFPDDKTFEITYQKIVAR